jgi:cellulose synthase/poly-beta-1,6-N-acetylglucosamine synthase-like glycosyltransferase
VSVPAVSLLLPCYNAAPFLAECITSLQLQTFDDYEVIAVDDGSTDDTPALLHAWATQDSRVRLLRIGRSGLIGALQHATAAARADLLARMDADDVAQPQRLARQADYLRKNKNIAACGTQVRYFPRAHVREGALAYESWLNSLTHPDDLARNIFVECPIAHPTLMIRAGVLREVGGYQEQGWPEDYDLMLRVWSAGHALANVPEVLLQWRERPERMSRTDPHYSLEAFRRCKVHYLLRTLARERSIVVWGAGPVGKAFARELIQQGADVRAFLDVDPRKIGQNIYGLPVHAPAEIHTFDGALFLAAVGSATARSEIRGELRRHGILELEGFVAVA